MILVMGLLVPEPISMKLLLMEMVSLGEPMLEALLKPQSFLT
jgi:hypothetical protein